MKAQYLGHVVSYVKNIERSLIFYRDLLGFQKIGRMFHGKAVALTTGRTHHELLLMKWEMPLVLSRCATWSLSYWA